MKKRITQIISAVILLAMIVSLMCITVGAVTVYPSSGYISSPSCVTGKITHGGSGTVKCQNTAIDDSDVGMYFYLLSSGMPDDFVKDESRKSYFDLCEIDPPKMDGDFVVRYIGTYSFLNGVYGTWNHYRVDNTKHFIIEGDNTAELYTEFIVMPVVGDKSITVEPNLTFKIRFWAV